MEITDVSDPAPKFFIPTPIVFMEISIAGQSVGTIKFQLNMDTTPKTSENFRALCTGEKGKSKHDDKELCYRGCSIHRVIKGFMAHGGDIINNDGSGGESIYGAKFPDESFKTKHLSRGDLSMANNGPNSNSS